MVIYINFSFDFLGLDKVILKITSPMNSSEDGSFFNSIRKYWFPTYMTGRLNIKELREYLQ
jgi:hypothetical protein